MLDRIEVAVIGVPHGARNRIRDGFRFSLNPSYALMGATAFARSSTALSNTLQPAVTSSGLASSISLWLIPPKTSLPGRRAPSLAPDAYPTGLGDRGSIA